MCPSIEPPRRSRGKGHLPRRTLQTHHSCSHPPRTRTSRYFRCQHPRQCSRQWPYVAQCHGLVRLHFPRAHGVRQAGYLPVQSRPETPSRPPAPHRLQRRRSRLREVILSPEVHLLCGSPDGEWVHGLGGLAQLPRIRGGEEGHCCAACGGDY